MLDLWPALAGDGTKDLRRLPRARSADRPDPGRGRLRRSRAEPRDPPQIWAESGDRPDHGAVHGAAGRTGEDRLLVPVPLHRTRLWGRGFNQSALVARELSRRLGIATDPLALGRARRTPPLKGMSPLERRKTVAGAFRVPDKTAVAGKTVILVDDVLTTGSTAEACARTLKRAGAARVELLSFARVVKPSLLMR
jgi:hypothetical protein